MKKNLFFALIMLVAGFAVGQQQNIPEVKVTPPQFAGIENALKVQSNSQNALIDDYLAKNVNFPEWAESWGFEGTEVVQFTVTTEGNVTDFKIINSVCREIDNEVIWALTQTNGMWLPGYNNGKPVDMTKEVSVAFCLDKVPTKSVHHIFSEKATRYYASANKTLFEKHNPKKAMKLYTSGLNYLPYDHSLLLMRGVCRYELGDKEGAIQDWTRMTSLGGEIDMSEYMAQIEGMKGYDELVNFLNK
jgi:tetratricopeptide (TPR) repeat protein